MVFWGMDIGLGFGAYLLNYGRSRDDAVGRADVSNKRRNERITGGKKRNA